MNEEPADGVWAPGAVVWVKLGSCWWPGIVVDASTLPPNALRKLRKTPLAIVQFFQEEAYEFVRNETGIFDYQCDRKDEFIKKGLDVYRAKHGHMEKFPEDVIRAEELTGGDVEILTRDRFQEVKKESYKGIFGDAARRTPVSARRGRPSKSKQSTPKVASTPIRKVNRPSSNYKAHILVQGPSATPDRPLAPVASPAASPSLATSSPTTSSAPDHVTPSASTPSASTPLASNPSASTPSASTPAASTPGLYTCHACPFSSTRLNVMIMHTKTHSVTFTPYVPTPKKKLVKSPKSVKKAVAPKVENKSKKSHASSSKATKRMGGENTAVEPKKAKSVVEIKNTLLADWEDGDDSSMDAPLSSVAIGDKPESKESFDKVEIPVESTGIFEDSNGVKDLSEGTKDDNEIIENIEEIANDNADIVKDMDENAKEPLDSPEKASCFDFQEDEELPVDSARKMTRVKKTEARKAETEPDTSEDVAREVAELLEKTTVPELPSAPTSVKFQENFPEVEKAKSPDKPEETSPPEAPLHKVIFKTKTFFRSRHSRSQDAIEKYVAEQLTSVGLDAEADAGTSDTAPSPPAAPSPPPAPYVDAVKSARLAPKIQLKKMKAEAQLREKLNESPLSKDSDSLDMIRGEDRNSEFEMEIETCPEINANTQEQDERNESPQSKDIDFLCEPLKSDDWNSEIKSVPIAHSHSEVNNDYVSSINEEDDQNCHEQQSPEMESQLGVHKHLVDIDPTSAEDKQDITEKSKDMFEATTLSVDQTEIELVHEKLSESTASAVDALLSVSKDVDRLTKHIGEDPPEDLFEEDSKCEDNNEQVNGVELESNGIHLNSKSYKSKTFSESNQYTESQLDKETINLPNDDENKVAATCEKKDQHTEAEGPNINSVEESTILSKILIGESPIPNKILADESYLLNTHSSPNTASQIFLTNFSLDTEIPTEINKNLEVENQEMVSQPSTPTIQTIVKDSPITILESVTAPVVEIIPQTFTTDVPMEIPESVTESDLQIAQALISLPGTALGLKSDSILIQQPKTAQSLQLDHFSLENQHMDKITPQLRQDKAECKRTTCTETIFEKKQFCPEKILDYIETEAEKNLNFNAAQSLVEMSKSVDHVTSSDLNLDEKVETNDQFSPKNRPPEKLTVETEMAFLTNTDISEPSLSKDMFEMTSTKPKYESTSSKLLQILEEPPRAKPLVRMISPKGVTMPKDKILNFDVNNTTSSKISMTSPQKQKIIIRRTAPPPKTALSTLVETSQDKIVLSRSTKAPSKDGVSTYTIETTPEHKLESGKILIQQKVRKITRSPPRLLQKVKPQTTFITSTGTLIQQNTNVLSTELRPQKTFITGTLVQQNPSVSSTDSKPQNTIITGTLVQQKVGVSSTDLKPHNTIITGTAIQQKLAVTNTDLKPQTTLITGNLKQHNPKVSSTDVKNQKTSVGIVKQRSPTTDIKLQKALTAGNIMQQSPTVSSTEVKPQTSPITSSGNVVQQTSRVDDVFDINSMPIVLSDDILTAESIEKMPIVMSDSTPEKFTHTVKQFVKPTVKPVLKPIVPEVEKKTFKPIINKPETISKTILMTPVQEKSATPNILSKSPKMRGKPMILFEKVTGQQKIIVTNTDPNSKDIKVSGATHTVPQAPGKTEKFIILPANAAPRPGRTQKIVIGPQQGKTQILVSTKPVESSPAKTIINKPASAKQSAPEIVNPGGTVMIITNAQGGQSRIVLTPEHEKMLFPNKSLHNPPQKLIPRSIAPNSVIASKQHIIVTSVAAPMVKTISKPQPRIISKQKQQHTIITSKGHVIVPGGSKPASTIARSSGMEIRPATTMRTFAPASSKIIRTPAPAQQQPKEPVIILQQKSGSVMQLTAAQFEHLQRTGQIVQRNPVAKTPAKPMVQKQMVLLPTQETPPPRLIQKQKAKLGRPTTSSPAAKKPKLQERLVPVSELSAPPLMPAVTTVAPPAAPVAASLVAPLAPPLAPSVAPLPHATVSSLESQQNNFADLDNLEELLPSTAIARPAPDVPPPPPALPPPPVLPPPPPEPQQLPLSDSQLLAVPGENFGGPPNSFYLCVEENGTLTPIDNRPLVLENNQLVPMAIEDPGMMLGLVGGEGQLVLGEAVPESPQPERRDILAAALANTDVFRPEVPREDLAPDFRDLNASVSVHSRVSETSITLNQPIMTPLEVPSHADEQPAMAASIEDGLAVIGVTTPSVPTSLELPITVTNPRIAPKTTNPLSVSCSSTYHSTGPLPSPGNLSEYVSHAVEQGPISMPLLTEEDDNIGKSMPILTDDMAMENIASSVELTASSVDSVVDSGAEQDEEGSQWSRKLLTPCSDSSEGSVEIPIQQALQLSASDLPTHNGRPHDS